MAAPDSAAAASVPVFKCPAPGCGKSYAHRSSVSVHYARHHTSKGDWRHECPVCKMRFVRSVARDEHEATHRTPLDIAKRKAAASDARAAALQAAAEMAATALAAALAATDRANAELAAMRAAAAPPPLDPPIPAGRCRECRLDVSAAGAIPRACDHCGALLHPLCLYLLDVPKDADFFCNACLKRYEIAARSVEAAVMEAVGLDRTLATSGLERVRMSADGECFFRAVATAIGGTAADVATLRKAAGEAVYQLALWAEHPVLVARLAKANADAKHWKELFEKHGGEAWRQGVATTALALTASSERGAASRWNTVAMDVVPQLMPALIHRPVHVVRYNVHTRELHTDEYVPRWRPDGQGPGVEPRTEGSPILLCVSNAGVKLPHYDCLRQRETIAK